MKHTLLSTALVAALAFSAGTTQAASFTYHGSLQDSGKPAEGSYDIELTLYSAASGGSVIGGPLVMYKVPVSAGSFNTEADFGPLAKSFDQAFIGVRVRNAGKGEFAALETRAPVSAATTTSVCPGAWTLYGNGGTVPGTGANQNYIGTADAKNLVFGVNGVQVAQFDTNNNFAIQSAPIDPYTELTVGGNPGGYANIFMHQYGLSSGILMTTGDATSDVNNDAGFYLDQYNGSGGQARRFEIAGNTGAVNIYSNLGFVGTHNQEARFRLFSGDPNTAEAEEFQLYLTRYDGTNGLAFAVAPHQPSGGTLTTGLNGAQPGGFLRALTVGTDTTNGNGAYLSPGGTWTNTSSRTLKEAFAQIDAGAILDKLVALPISTWQYKNNDAEGTHLGPVAEDFKAAFGLGNDERHISTVDEEGVALAAIQGLNAKLQEQNNALRSEKDAEIADLQAKLGALSARLTKLETKPGE